MYATHFDRLVQAMTTSGSRRGLLRLSGVLPLSGVLSAFLAEGSEAAKHRHHARQHATDGQLEEQRKKKPRKCAPAGQTPSKKRKRCCAGLGKDATGRCAAPASGCTPAACPPGACGSVPDGCGGSLSCGGCGSTSLCLSGTCQPCDVCPSGCLFSSVQKAVNAGSSGESVRICAGVYAEDLTIGQDLTLIGAGDGNGAGNTIVQGSGTDSVVTISAGRTVKLQDLRITGGVGSFGGGIHHQGPLSLTGCTITGNKATVDGGGIYSSSLFNTFLTLTDCAITGNTAARGGGGIVSQSGALTLNRSTVSGNTSTGVDGGVGGGIFNGGQLTMDAASRVTGNTANRANSNSGGGIFNAGIVTLSSAENVTGNAPRNCGGFSVSQCIG